MTFNRLHNDNGIINNQAYGQHQAEKRQGVDGESEKRKEGKSADDGNRNGECRNEGRPPTLKEDEDNENNQGQSNQQCFYNLADAFSHGLCCIKTNNIINIRRELCLGTFHYSSDAFGCFDGIRTRQLVNTNIGGRFSIQTPPECINLRAHFNTGYIFQTNNRSIGFGPQNDLAEFFGRDQTSLSADGIGELLAWRRGFSPDLSCRINCVLLLDSINDLRNGYTELRQLIGFDPDADRIHAGTPDRGHANAGHAQQLID